MYPEIKVLFDGKVILNGAVEFRYCVWGYSDTLAIFLTMTTNAIQSIGTKI